VTWRRCRALILTAAITLRPAAAAAALVLISVPEEIAMGRHAQAAMAARTPRIAAADVQDYIRRIGHRLAASAGGPGFAYSFDVANRAEVNALALPGGHVWVYRGALAVARSESELAGVIAHKIAHVVARHAARQASTAMVAAVGLELLSALLGNTGGAVTSGLAANALTGSVFLGFSRDDELVADREGTRILRKAGWDPDGLASFLEAARASARTNPGALEVFFSTHPATADRIAALREGGARHGAASRDNAAFAAMKKRLSALPPPHRPHM
jgi:predicted Zn-dependent protease